jgi:hypothetical protein
MERFPWNGLLRSIYDHDAFNDRKQRVLEFVTPGNQSFSR